MNTQTIFVEENISDQQIINLCKLIDSNACKSIEFRRCMISDSVFDALTESVSKNGIIMISLIFNIQMINEKHRFKKFIQMLTYCPNLINLRIHGNGIDDNMFSQLYSIICEYCPKLTSMDIGDNKLTDKSIVHLCGLIIPDDKKLGLEELILSANRSITNAGWRELLLSISYSSRIRRLAFDYNILDNITVAMLTMVIASSRTLTYLDLECCHLTEYDGQLFLSLFTKYPVKLEEICLDQNPAILGSTRTLINECFSLKSRQNSISNPRPVSFRLPITDDLANTNSTISETISPLKLKKKKKKGNLSEPPDIIIKEETKPVSFTDVKQREKSAEIKKKEMEEEKEIEELLPVETEPYGIAGRTLYWRRI